MSPHLSLPYGRPHNRNPQDGAGSDLETCFGLIAHSYSLRKCVSSRGASGYCSLWEGRASMRRTSSDWRREPVLVRIRLTWKRAVSRVVPR